MSRGHYLGIKAALLSAGFDECCQAGSVSRFHKMHIVADSAALDLRFWFCVSGGYRVQDELYMITRRLGTDGPDEFVRFKNQQEMIAQIEAIRQKIKGASK